MAHRRRAALLVSSLALSPIAGAASMTITQTLLHTLESKGLSAVQARSAALVASHHYHSQALQPVLASIKGIPRLPAHYYSHGTLKGQAGTGLTRVLTSAFRNHAGPARVQSAAGAYTHAVAKGAPPQTTGQLLVSALHHGVTAPRLKALVASYLRRYKAGASAQNALHKAKGTLSRYGL